MSSIACALRELLQKETAPLRVHLCPIESAHGFGNTVRCFRAMRVRCTATAVLIGMTWISCCSVGRRRRSSCCSPGSSCFVSQILPWGGAGTCVNGRDANVVPETVFATLRLSCLRARRPVDFCGHPPSLGSCVRRVRGIPCRPRCPRSTRLLRAPPVHARRSSPLLFHPSRGSGCPVHKKQLLPVLVVLAPPRKNALGCELLLRVAGRPRACRHVRCEVPRQGGCPP